MRRVSKPVCTVVGTKSTGSKWSPVVEDMALYAGAVAARAGFVVVTGGKSGVMATAARGAKSQGGLTIGILPEADRSLANEWIDIVIPTGIGLARNVLTALVADCMIAVPGGHGTLQEMSYAIEYERPVLSWNSWCFEGVTIVEDETDRQRVDDWIREQIVRLRRKDEV